MAVIIPSLEKAQKEDGEAGRRKIQQYTRMFTVVLALFQAIIFALALFKMPGAILPGVNSFVFFQLYSKDMLYDDLIQEILLDYLVLIKP